MELIKSVSRRSRLGEVAHFGLNIAYAAALFGLVLAYQPQPPYLAYLLVLLSKWRVLAVRPRFWFANIQANSVDLFVGLSVVTLMWVSSGSAGVQLALTVFFAIWLTILKPHAKRSWVIIQAAIMQALSLTALFSFAYVLPASFATLVGWLIGYITARHALASFKDEEDRTLLSLAWGLVVAELSWLSYHWTIAYTLSGELKIPQVAIVVGLLGFLAMKVYVSLRKNAQQLLFRDIRWPLTFVLLVIALLMVRFNGMDMTQL
jgi:hypothetical protein